MWVLGDILSQCHSVHHKSHMDWPGTVEGTPAVRGRRITVWATAWFLGAFAKFRKATISFVMSVCLSGFQWTDFHEIWYLIIFRKYADKIQVSLKSDNNNGTLHQNLCTVMIISRWILLRMRNVSDRICKKDQTTHFIFRIFFSENCNVYEIMCKNMLQLDRPQMTI
jgi:hypothetical protein